ncbi:MAG TPA: site-2 protease family protein [Terriglobales bacterium]
MSNPASSVTPAGFPAPIEVFVVQPPRPRYWLHALLLAATFFTMLVVGAHMEFNFRHGVSAFAQSDDFIPFFPIAWVFASPARLLLGLPFALTLAVILLAHEMGHYFYCRHYSVQATLPFFIPAPTLIGTLGAVIRIKSPIRSRAALFDIGIAGPVAGFVIACIALIFALLLSAPLPPGSPPPALTLGFPLIFHAFAGLLALAGLSSGTLDSLNLHPTAIAAWVGMFATALNLLPSGQLDGGHMVYALWPRAHRTVSWLVVLALAFLGWHSISWRTWAVLVAAMNILTWRQRQAPDFPGIHGSRWIWALVGLLMLALTFAPTPFVFHDF